eukprot:scaffold10284_cov118-Isochrysis_galbana.AAC.17
MRRASSACTNASAAICITLAINGIVMTAGAEVEACLRVRDRVVLALSRGVPDANLAAVTFSKAISGRQGADKCKRAKSMVQAVGGWRTSSCASTHS